MLIWIFGVLVLFFVQTLLAPMVRWWSDGGRHLKAALGPRDNPPPMPVIGARFDRALGNMIEAMLVFLPLALLAEMRGIASGLAVQGAAVFLIARLIYVPAYISGIPGLRSAVWMCGHAGLVMMAVALL